MLIPLNACWIILVLWLLTSTNWLDCSFLSHFLILFRLSVLVLPFFGVFMLLNCVFLFECMQKVVKITSFI